MCPFNSLLALNAAAHYSTSNTSVLAIFRMFCFIRALCKCFVVARKHSVRDTRLHFWPQPNGLAHAIHGVGINIVAKLAAALFSFFFAFSSRCQKDYFFFVIARGATETVSLTHRTTNRTHRHLLVLPKYRHEITGHTYIHRETLSQHTKCK